MNQRQLKGEIPQRKVQQHLVAQQHIKQLQHHSV